MHEILEKRALNANTWLMRIHAPLVAKRCEPGQFIIFRIDEQGERVPLTIADYDRASDSVTIIFQAIGASTIALSKLNQGDFISDFAGPLGNASKLEGHKNVAIIGGGVGCAIAYPQAKKLFGMGCKVDLIAGFRSKDIVMLEDEMRANSTHLFITTDDGSYGEKGLVTDKLKALIESGEKYDEVIAIGPVIMMKFVTLTAKAYGIPVTVSLNPIMVDGTGMCGGCRVTVGGETKFACVDGPEFDGYQVDFDELMRRNTAYKTHESEASHKCRLIKE
ncbi:MAG TPA: sulfide/dihydroorotate dehydrogenase-like FAD/NAD-binding protein [Oscillospiraceae bacterium]|nr:sulfide/dihydroorotate dehydrogenase-like FAD/NAD-binding protein [Oscillospiraceae bacterium]HPF56552.1 sulfide/dihydroorotate dehydrogenase-like FAD/NAD-binding protein [Clostridiales bacterium]HPK34330.1 sulfide/dihydroorotate dehydrogenase-like FAD/NAD-binding protein [Oscillospiraceae bacterium]HPR75109.1 sulfide/dihydroorotate dehydrogenase-like FAD/NAD-binding protein [Oscillospiraceae bacterium]